MNFKPSTEEEIKANKVWTPGVYDFLIVKAEEKLSQRNANPMIELRLEVTKRDGTKRFVKDYLHAQREEKLMQAAKACGVLDKFNAGSLDEDDFVGKSGKLKLGIECNRMYPTKNVVIGYVG